MSCSFECSCESWNSIFPCGFGFGFGFGVGFELLFLVSVCVTSNYYERRVTKVPCAW